MRLFILLLLPLLILAQEQPSILEKMARPQVSLQSAWLSPAAFKGYDGTVRTSKQSLRISNGFGGIALSRWYFHWDDEQSLPFYRGKTPIKNMQRIKLFGNYYHRFNDRWAMIAMLNVNATYEQELYGDAVGAGVMAFFSYRLGAEHAIQMGAFVNYHPVTTLALPAIGYSYRARADDGFQMVLGFPRAYIGYHPARGYLVRAGFVYSQAVIRLANDSGIEPSGYIEAADYQASFGVRIQFDGGWELNTDLLYAFSREMQLYDSGAHKTNAYRIEPSAGAMLRLIYAF